MGANSIFFMLMTENKQSYWLEVPGLDILKELRKVLHYKINQQCDVTVNKANKILEKH